MCGAVSRRQSSAITKEQNERRSACGTPYALILRAWGEKIFRIGYAEKQKGGVSRGKETEI